MAIPSIPRKELISLLGERWVKDDPATCYSYRCDGLTLHTGPPLGVIFPGDTQGLAAAVKLLHREKIPFLPRGAGTGLSGGAVPRHGGVLIDMFRFRAIGAVDLINRTIAVGPGVVNIHVTHAAKPHGFYFVPDPSSQKACTVGGNVGENSGGPHTLKYGVTVNHVLELEVVMPDGEVETVGGPCFGTPGPDLLALMIGSEGTLGIVTKVLCRLMPLPEKTITQLAVFEKVADASRTVSRIIREGIIPAALEMVDNVVIRAVEKSMPAGFPEDAAAVLIIEVEDLVDGLDQAAERIEKLALEEGATEMRRARDEVEKAKIWRARKEALGALGALSPSFYTQDGVIPRSRLPEVLDRIITIGKQHRLLIANVFHAGDGNLHPLILFDSQNPGEIERVHQVGKEILEICLEVGGTLSGEHGIGLEKDYLMDQVFSPHDLSFMESLRAVFNPEGLLNPGKILPSPGKCSEAKMVRAKAGIAV